MRIIDAVLEVMSRRGVTRPKLATASSRSNALPCNRAVETRDRLPMLHVSFAFSLGRH
jgi:hypothetical protein